jgi:hypothetical protein
MEQLFHPVNLGLWKKETELALHLKIDDASCLIDLGIPLNRIILMASKKGKDRNQSTI